MAVTSPDPISREGVLTRLRRRPGIEVREESGRPEPGTVRVFVHGVLHGMALTRLRQAVQDEGARVVLVVNPLREAQLFDVVQCGVDVIVWRHEATADRLARAVRAAARGDADLPAGLLGRAISQAAERYRDAVGTPGLPTAGLTPREQDVLRLAAEGYGTGETAAKLSCSEETVRSALDEVTARLRLRNTEHAVAYAIREGFI